MVNSTSANLFRREAAKCREVSHAMESHDKRAYWLQLADDYDKMAEQEERRAASTSE